MVNFPPPFEHHGLPLAEMSQFKQLKCYQQNKIIISTEKDDD